MVPSTSSGAPQEASPRAQATSGSGEHPLARADYESTALERSSYITALVHLYRGEMSRANTWRSRLDQTTHWAIMVLALALPFSFGQFGHHAALLFTHLLILILLMLESRRFRFYDVWRSRIRKIENNFFGPILERRLQSPESDWMLLVARDLAEPHFHLTRLQAMRVRLARNYVPIYAVLILAWFVKIVVEPQPAEHLSELYGRCAIGHIPGWVTLAAVGAFYTALLLVLVLARTDREGRDNWDIGETVEEYR